MSSRAPSKNGNKPEEKREKKGRQTEKESVHTHTRIYAHATRLLLHRQVMRMYRFYHFICPRLFHARTFDAWHTPYSMMTKNVAPFTFDEERKRSVHTHAPKEGKKKKEKSGSDSGWLTIKIINLSSPLVERYSILNVFV